MPELPEVEVTRLSFVGEITGARVVSVCMGKALRWPLGCSVAQLAGRTVRAVRRRGKYLLIDLDQGLLLVHDHFEMLTTRGTLRLNDPRRFGAVVYADSEDAPEARKLLARLGMEPLSDGFDAKQFHAELKLRKTVIKQVLLAGDIVVGVGNIYASEALFMAGIKPTLSAAKLSRPRAVKLHAAIRDVLARAVAKGGSTLRDFSSTNGERGYFQLEAMVYGREGQACRVCGTPIKAIRQGQRSTFYCPNCQKT